VFPPQPNDPHRLVILPFRYGVTLTTSGLMIFCLPTQVLFLKPQLTSTKVNHFIPLSWFILMTIGGQYF